MLLLEYYSLHDGCFAWSRRSWILICVFSIGFNDIYFCLFVFVSFSLVFTISIHFIYQNLWKQNVFFLLIAIVIRSEICGSAYRQNLWAELIIKIPVDMYSIFMKLYVTWPTSPRFLCRPTAFLSTCWSHGTSESSTYEKKRICPSNSALAHFHVSWLSDFIFYPKPLCTSLHLFFLFIHNHLTLTLTNRYVSDKSSRRKLYGRHRDLVDRYGISVSQMTTDMFHLS